MKTALLLLAVAGPALAQLPPTSIKPRDIHPTAKNGGAEAQVIQADVSAEPRHFKLTATWSNNDGTLANGGFYELDTTLADAKPFHTALDDKPGDERRHADDNSPLHWHPSGDIFIRGLKTIPDAAPWKGMLQPDGLYRYETLLGGMKTVRAYKLSQAEDPVEKYWAANKANPKLTDALDTRPDSAHTGHR